MSPFVIMYDIWVFKLSSQEGDYFTFKLLLLTHAIRRAPESKFLSQYKKLLPYVLVSLILSSFFALNHEECYKN